MSERAKERVASVGCWGASALAIYSRVCNIFSLEWWLVFVLSHLKVQQLVDDLIFSVADAQLESKQQNNIQ